MYVGIFANVSVCIHMHFGMIYYVHVYLQFNVIHIYYIYRFIKREGGLIICIMLSISVWRLCFFQMNPSACHDVPHVFFSGIDSARTCSWWKQCCLIMNLERWHFLLDVSSSWRQWYDIIFHILKKHYFLFQVFNFLYLYIYIIIYIYIYILV